MKLTSHQKKIIDAIVTKKVWDIPSYLEHFGKLHQCQYVFERIRTTFEQTENGRTYRFRKGDDAYYYTDTLDRDGNICNTRRVPNSTTYEFVDYPMTVPVKACLNKKVNIECYEDGNTKFLFDFLKESYPVADSFDDIIDFFRNPVSCRMQEVRHRRDSAPAGGPVPYGQGRGHDRIRSCHFPDRIQRTEKRIPHLR